MSITRRAFWPAVLAFSLFQNTAAAQTVFSISVETDQSSYLTGQTVSVVVEACNHTSTTAVDHYPGLCDRDQFQIFDDNSLLVAYSDFSPWCPPYSIPVELTPGECRILEVWQWRQIAGGSPHQAYGDQVDPGVYSVVANFFDITSEPAAFEILAAPQAAPVPTLRIQGMIVLGLALAFGGFVVLRRRI